MSTSRSAPFTLAYCPEIDGLRALAITMVVLFNLKVPHVWSGYIGVRIFFVVSGYLITALLLEQLAERGTVALGEFYLRRFRRLVPPLALMLLGYLSLIFVQRGSAGLEGAMYEVLFAVSYMANWTYVYFGTPHDLGHTWSLAVEEQFYAVWPLVLLGAWRWRRLKGVLWVAIGILVALLAIRPAMVNAIFDPRQGQLRLYMGTDVGASGLLMGSVVAMLGATTRGVAVMRGKTMTRVAPWLALTVLAAYSAWLRTLDLVAASTYVWGLPAVEAATALLIVALQAPGANVVQRVFASPPAVWLGRASYSLYLWHAVVAVAAENRGLLLADCWPWTLAASLLCGAVAYLVMERAILQRSPRRGLPAARSTSA